VSDEFNTVDNERRERAPEDVVGEDLREATLLVTEELVDEDTADDVDENADKEKDQDNTSKAETSRVLDRDTTSRSVTDGCLKVAAVDVLLEIDNAGSGGIGADDVDSGSALCTSVADAAAGVLHGDTLVRSDTRLGDNRESLGGKSTKAVSEVKRSALTNRGSRVTGSVGVSTKIEESRCGTISAGTVNNSVSVSIFMEKGSEIVTIRVMSLLICDDLITFEWLSCSEKDQKRKEIKFFRKKPPNQN